MQSYSWPLLEHIQIWNECHLEESLKSICFYTFRIIALFLNMLMVNTGQIKAEGTEDLILIKSFVQATLAHASTRSSWWVIYLLPKRSFPLSTHLGDRPLTSVEDSFRFNTTSTNILQGWPCLTVHSPRESSVFHRWKLVISSGYCLGART